MPFDTLTSWGLIFSLLVLVVVIYFLAIHYYTARVGEPSFTKSDLMKQAGFVLSETAFTATDEDGVELHIEFFTSQKFLLLELIDDNNHKFVDYMFTIDQRVELVNFLIQNLPEKDLCRIISVDSMWRLHSQIESLTGWS